MKRLPFLQFAVDWRIAFVVLLLTATVAVTSLQYSQFDVDDTATPYQVEPITGPINDQGGGG